jgi:peptide/nickel transport system substrate-binding protein
MSKLKELENLLTDGKITRRTFIARVSAMGLMAAVSPALLNSKAVAATPQKGGKLIMGSAGG